MSMQAGTCDPNHLETWIWLYLKMQAAVVSSQITLSHNPLSKGILLSQKLQILDFFVDYSSWYSLMYRCVFESAAGICGYRESHKYRACCNVDASWNMGIRSKLFWNLNLIVPEDSSCNFFRGYSFWQSPKHRNSNCTQSCNLWFLHRLL
jgi:hypothetical protein